MDYSALFVYLALTLITLSDVVIIIAHGHSYICCAAEHKTKLNPSSDLAWSSYGYSSGHTLSLSVSSALSGPLDEDTDWAVTVGYYSASDAWYETSQSCSVNLPSGGLFYLSGSSIIKGDCYACLSYATASSYTVEVHCSADRVFGFFGTSNEYASITVYISPNNPPYFTNTVYSVTVNGFTVYAGQNVYDLDWWDTDTSVSSLSVSYTAPATSHVFGNTLWNFITGNGIIIATKTMSEEFTNTYYLTVTVADRRTTVSTTVTINLNACHITPNCTDQSKTIADTFTIGGTLFTQTVPNSGLFSGLSFSMSTALSQAYIISSTGTITTIGNITVHPYYPSRTWTIYVTVSASGSCYTHTCTMTLTVTFTNWPLFITSLPASTTVHEDTDSFIPIHSLITWDNNYNYQDNVTCYISSDPLTGACAGTLFQLVNDGYYNDTSYTLYKKSCNSPGCGVICDTNGCLDHDVTTSYVIGITCYDGYGSSDTDTFTMYVRQNDPPIFTNLANSITLNTDIIARGDVLFTIYYTDTENENLRYNYTYNGVVGNNLFVGDTNGNYHNNAANITAIANQWDLSNASFSVYICGSERRNTRCGTLTINIRDYCATAPVCNSASITVTDRFAVGGTLFTINVSNRLSLSGTQSYTVYSEHSYFNVSPSGVIRTTASLSAIYPSTRYYINARVYDTAACSFAYCQFQVTVTFTNDPISITNLGSSAVVSIHEDTVVETALYTIQTSDATKDDSVTCNVTSTSPVTTAFKTKETYPGSDVYRILSKAYPGFAHDTCNQYRINIDCWDSYGSRASSYFTVNIEDNQAPVFTNLAASKSINVDPATTFAGAAIFTVTTTDAEKDNLFYNYTIYNQRTPFNMSTNAVVSLHRNISVHEEDGAMYWIRICVYDLHNQVCGNLTVTFTSSKTRPIIGNLPASVAVPESMTSGSTIFIVSVTDPDVGDIHNVSMSVTPAGSTSKFSLNSLTGVLSLASGQKFDYETLSFYQITFSVRDQYLAANASKILNISITDVNETPYFVSTISDITFGEGTAGTVVGTPSIQCKDPDPADRLTFSISGPHQAYFNMNRTTGKLTLAQDWNLESGLATSTYLTVYCEDPSGLRAATNLNLNITAVNEFVPVLSIYTAEINVTDQTRTTQVLLNITATDQDFGDDNSFHFYIIGFGFGSKYFTIDGNGTLGQLSLLRQIKLKYAFNATFTVGVSDNETSPLVSSVTITIYYTPTPPDPQKPPSYCTLCTKEGIAVVSILAIEGFAIFAVIVYVILKYSKPICATTPTISPSSKPQCVLEQKKQEFDTISQNSVQSNVSESSEVSTDSELSDTSSGSDASSLSSYSV